VGFARAARGRDDGVPRAAAARQGVQTPRPWWRTPVSVWRARAWRAWRESATRRDSARFKFCLPEFDQFKLHFFE
jgi:hypothetical protein